MNWTEVEIDKLKSLAGQMLYVDIAKILKRSPAMVTFQARKLRLPKARHLLGKWNSKHSHLQEEVLIYYQKHSFEETAKKFDLTISEMKSCMTYAYRRADLSHLRKATNDHSPWSSQQLKFLLRHAGLRDREWIAKKIGRGNKTCIKERMQFLGIASRNLQGLTMSQFIEAFGKRPNFFLQTTAGPRSRSAAPTLWKIVPWVWLDQEIKGGRLQTAIEMKILVSTHAIFQEWIFDGNSIAKMKRICAAGRKQIGLTTWRGK